MTFPPFVGQGKSQFQQFHPFHPSISTLSIRFQLLRRGFEDAQLWFGPNLIQYRVFSLRGSSRNSPSRSPRGLVLDLPP